MQMVWGSPLEAVQGMWGEVPHRAMYGSVLFAKVSEAGGAAEGERDKG